MILTREELKMAHNNVMVVMENHIIAMTRCDRMTANLVANEVLSLDRDAEYLLNNDDEEEIKNCNTCIHLVNDCCNLDGEGCQTEMYECYESK